MSSCQVHYENVVFDCYLFIAAFLSPVLTEIFEISLFPVSIFRQNLQNRGWHSD